ncbi:MAG: DUF5703 domain-containing protein [Candidatus Methylacidiphilales bacterium]|nr:DUF5703 domain-containing protein [Candidatus Methylacidiphilales bacterium]
MDPFPLTSPRGAFARHCGRTPVWRALCLGLLAASALVAVPKAQSADIGPADLAPYNVVWESPSADSAGSMPLGNGETGINLWVEKSTGDVLLYIARGDAWTENVVLYRGDYGLAKVGRIRIKLGNGAFRNPQHFRQEYDLATASVTVQADGTTLRAWVDAHSSLIRLEFNAAKPFSLQAGIDTYRKEELRGTLKFQKVLWSDTLQPAEGDDCLILSKDTLLEPGPSQIGWCYQNRNPYRIPELQDWTFGALVFGQNMRTNGPSLLESAEPSSVQRLMIATAAFPAESVPAWQHLAAGRAALSRPRDWATDWAAHVAWWHQFWNRSYILVEGNEAARRLTQGYLLARQIQAFQGRGRYPIKFNGGLFNFDNTTKVRNLKSGEFEERGVNGDFRQWGGHYWFQNTRPMYWPMMAAGDFDLMQPFFRMYRDILFRNEKDCRAHYGHAGAYLAETSPFTGGLPRVLPEQEGNHTRHYYTPVLELGALMLDYFDHTQDEKFAREYLVPMMDLGLAFFREHFPRDGEGRLRIEPANSAEMFWKTRNPVTDVAGLHYLLPRLIALPTTCLPEKTRSQWRSMRDALPPIPMRKEGANTRILPYESAIDPKEHNQENPELYAIYPFRLFTLGQGAEKEAVGRYNFGLRRFKRAGCWYQDPVQAALVGDTASAAEGALFALTNKDPRCRFPAFWNIGNDYAPDFDNGGHGMHALQLMLLQSSGSSVYVAPAWPSQWNARFRLHAAGKTTVEGRIKDGRPVDLVFSPAIRRVNAVLPIGKNTP